MLGSSKAYEICLSKTLVVVLHLNNSDDYYVCIQEPRTIHAFNFFQCLLCGLLFVPCLTCLGLETKDARINVVFSYIRDIS